MQPSPSLEVGTFVDWLCTHAHEVVGQPGTCFHCPLARWISDLYGHSYGVEDHTYGRACVDPRFWAPLPLWAQWLVAHLEHFLLHSMTGEEVFDVLAYVELAIVDARTRREERMPPLLQRYALYHAINPWAMVRPQERNFRHDPAQHYRHVATVQAPLEQIFALTNHRKDDEQESGDWTQRPEIIWHAPDLPLRSTSIGDVIVSLETNQAWMVMPSELKEII